MPAAFTHIEITWALSSMVPKVRSVTWGFFPDDIESYVKDSRCKWIDKFFAHQERPLVPLVSLVAY